MHDTSDVVYAVGRVQTAVSSLSSTVNWISILLLAVVTGGCNPAADKQSLVEACEAEAMSHSLAAASFLPRCMGGKGHEYRWELPQCYGAFASSPPDCWEARGWWRSTKLWSRRTWASLHNKA